MNKDQIIQLAKEAGLTVRGFDIFEGDGYHIQTEEIEALIAIAYSAGVNAERNACAAICENYTDNALGNFVDHESHGYTIANIIRSRGNA